MTRGINLLTQWVGAALTSSRGKQSHVGFPCIRSQRNWHRIGDIFAVFNVDLTIGSPGTLTLCSTILFVLAILCPGQFVLHWHSWQIPSESGRDKGYILIEGRIYLWLFILMLTPKKRSFFPRRWVASDPPDISGTRSAQPSLDATPEHMLSSFCSTIFLPDLQSHYLNWSTSSGCDWILN